MATFDESNEKANRSTRTHLTKTVDILSTDTNLLDIFRYNQFSEDIEFTKSPAWDSGGAGRNMTDQDITDLRYYLGGVHNCEPSKQIVGEACYIMAKRKPYHPVKKFIEAEEWDNVPRINEWLTRAVGCEDNAYTQGVSANILVATVNRIYNPGCKFDHMMILEGKQGIYKSTLVELMAGGFFLDTNFDNHDKDLIDGMRGAIWIEISELSGMNKKDVDWLKGFITRKVDRVRLPYASRSQDFKRKCVFIGTYNPSGNNQYLRDDTGNRRFWPIECNKMIDIDYIREVRGQLWAEAYARYKTGEIYYLNKEDQLNILTSVHSEREIESPTQKQIRDWLEPRYEVNMEEILHDCLKMPQGKSPKELLSAATVVGIIMRKLQWRKGKNEDRDKYYSPSDKPLSSVEPEEQEIAWND